MAQAVESQGSVDLEILLYGLEWDLAETAIDHMAGDTRPVWRAALRARIAHEKADGQAELAWLEAGARALDGAVGAEAEQRYELSVRCLIAGHSELAARLLSVASPEKDDGWVMARLSAMFGVETRRRLGEFRRPVILPLGVDCLSGEIARRWGFRPWMWEGPFEAALYDRQGASKALEDRFERLLDPQSYKVVTTPVGLQALAVPAYSLLMNHEAGPYWFRDGPGPIIELYQRRVRSLATYQLSPKIFFVSQYHMVRLDLSRLIGAVDSYFQNDWTMIVHWTRGEPPNLEDARVRVVYSPMPIAYTWYLPADYHSSRGVDFERPVAEALRDALERQGA